VSGLNFEFNLQMYQIGAAMVDRYYFETKETERSNHPARVRTRFAKRAVQSEMRKQREIGNNRTAAARIRNVITGLERIIFSLNGSIEAVLEGTQVRDPSNFAYPVAARTMGMRRDNIKATIAVLSGQLAKIDDPQTDI
jgi:hypothetical protein